MQTAFGSHLYGLETPTSDKDFKAIFMPNVKDILLGTIPKTMKISSGSDHVRNTVEDVDSEAYSLHHFVRLALQGQTVALDLLHGAQETKACDTWFFLKKNRWRFYTRNMRSFIGYARKQAAKYGIKGSRLDAIREVLAFLITQGDKSLHQIWGEGSMWTSEHTHIHLEFITAQSYWDVCGKKLTFGTKASEYVPMLQKFFDSYGKRAQLAAKNEGVDWKAVSHALRVGYQTKNIFEKRTFSYPLKETPYLLAVKMGQLQYKEVAGTLDNLIEELERMADRSSLPEKPDEEFWEEWLARTTLGFIKGEYDLVEDPGLEL
jgi:hypothetical protein